MRVLNKSSSMPAFAPEGSQGSISAKPHRRRLQELQNEVNKSRMAIVRVYDTKENMSHTRAIQNGLYIKVEDLQKELHHCIVNLNQQSERGKVLNELVGILKGQMSAVQAVQRTSEEFVSCGIQKKIKKVEYDIKQLLHKYNEEIAKINSLKEQANAARDERVVYSNLFNKIQKEIKHYQETYKQTLIKNEIYLDKKRANSLPPLQELDPVQTPEKSERIQKIDFKERQSKVSCSRSRKDLKSKDQIKSFKFTDRSNQNDLEGFITDPQTTVKLSSTSNYKESTSPSKLPASRSIETEIRNKETAIEVTVINSQCRSLEEVLELYSSVETHNQDLAIEVQQLDQNIEYLQAQIDRIKRQKRSSQIYQNRQISEMANISKNCRSNKSAITQEPSSRPQAHFRTLMKICKLMNIEPQRLGDDVLREIDWKIESLGCTVGKKGGKRSSRVEEGSQRGVFELLEKIDRFGESQKIFDRNMLCAEYHREVGKVRKRGKKTN